MKDIRSQGVRRFVQCSFFSDKGEEKFLQMRTFALFGPRNFGFFKIYGVSAWTKGCWRTSADILRIMGKGQFFAIFCGHFLWTASKVYYYYVLPKLIVLISKYWLPRHTGQFLKT